MGSQFPFFPSRGAAMKTEFLSSWVYSTSFLWIQSLFSLLDQSDWAVLVFFNPKKRWELSQIPNSDGGVTESKELGSKDIQRCLPSPVTDFPAQIHKRRAESFQEKKKKSDQTSFSVGFSSNKDIPMEWKWNERRSWEQGRWKLELNNLGAVTMDPCPAAGMWPGGAEQGTAHSLGDR